MHNSPSTTCYAATPQALGKSRQHLHSTCTCHQKRHPRSNSQNTTYYHAPPLDYAPLSELSMAKVAPSYRLIFNPQPDLPSNAMKPCPHAPTTAQIMRVLLRMQVDHGNRGSFIISKLPPPQSTAACACAATSDRQVPRTPCGTWFKADDPTGSQPAQDHLPSHPGAATRMPQAVTT